VVVPFVDICGIVDRHCFDFHNVRKVQIISTF